MADLHERLNQRVNRDAVILALIVCCIVGVAGFALVAPP
jgi:hypothetical protein